MKYNNSQKRIIEDDYIYFLTSKTKNNFSYFNDPILCDLWIEELKLCKQLKKFKLYAFCLLPDHFHLLLKPHKKYDISEIIRSSKTNFSRNANRIMLPSNIILPKARSRDLALNTKKYEKYLNNLQKQFIQKYKQNYLFSKFQWQSSFHDHVIRDNTDFEYHFNYTKFNFDKHELSESWKYSSLYFPDLIDEPL